MYFPKIGGFDLKEKLGRAVRALGLYLDDLLLLAGGGCFVRAGLTAYAVVVARSRGGGRR